MKLLAIDVGNTSIACALFRGGRVVKRARLATSLARTGGKAFFKKHFASARPEAAVIGSVVPEAEKVLKKILPTATGAKTYLIGKDLRVPIVNRYRNPRQVGADRLLNALAAWEKYRRAAVVIDFGTAITFDIVSPRGAYLGGVIAPGIEISLESLFQKTALLPRIRLSHPRGVLGRDTVESIRSGCAYGIGGLCDRIVSEIGEACGFKPIVLATGGYARFMSRYCRPFRAIEPDLTLRGLFLTYQARAPKA
jgi:type III pantothenate kinase